VAARHGCPGCFTPITEDWQTDATLTKVVRKAVAGTNDFLAKTYPDQVGSIKLENVQVSEFEKQVRFFYTNCAFFLHKLCVFFLHKLCVFLSAQIVRFFCTNGQSSSLMIAGCT
jgi:hypothetical protein